MIGKVSCLIGSMWLLAGSADVRAAERLDALDRAIAAGDVVGARLQLDAGADAATGFGGFARLSLAASQRPCVPDIITALIELGAEPKAKDPAVRSTALLHSAASGSKECFQVLLAAGSDPSHVNVVASGIVTEAYLSGQRAFFEWVLANRKASPKHPDDLAKALLVSLKKNDWGACGLLLAAGADPKRRVVLERTSWSVEGSLEGAMLGRCDAPGKGPLRDYVLVSAVVPGNTGATISLPDRYVRVFTDVFVIEDCDPGAYAICFRSDYMSFAAPSDTSRDHWTLGEAEFRRTGLCRPTAGYPDAMACVIRSRQATGLFDFLYSETEGLVGWRWVYALRDGSLHADEWLAEGLVNP